MTSDSQALTTAPVQHDPLEHYGHDRGGGISNPILGMMLFITSEVMFFAGLFAAYFNSRAAADVWPPEEFAHTLQIMPFVGPATILLIISSFTCQMAVWAIRKGDRTRFLRAMAVTLGLGITFLLMQAVDYFMLGHEGLTLSSGVFGTTYYTLTGFHGAHVFGGVIMLAVVLYRGMAGQFSARHHDAVEAASLYWHFVDVVWILLFTILYLVPASS
jgi:cytochrome c oxidase subunit 3